MIDRAPSVGFFSRLANPGHFLGWSRHAIAPLAVIAALLFAIGLWLALLGSPEDYQMGSTVRIMYVHVPNAWLAQLCYGVMAVAALGTLVWRHPLADVTAKAAAPLGAAFTAIALITGALWGRPTWGTFWEWDGRMTSTLVLLFIYLGIIVLWRTFEDQARAGRVIAVFTLVGAVNIPIIKFSVDWWNTLHQPASVFRAGGPTMPASILAPLLTMTAAFTVLFAVLQIVSMRTEILRRRADSMQRQHASELSARPA
jgi:heme exporter protein C